MTVVRINAITVAPGGGEELARRFAARAGAVDKAEGFEGFELLRPSDERDTWLVVTRWRDEQAFAAWVSSPAFAHGHRAVAEGAENPHGADAGTSGDTGEGPGAGSGHDHRAPVATGSELWSYEVVDLGTRR